ncbi:MAG: hypothetical protein ACK55I_30445, partial [bacterium]
GQHSVCAGRPGAQLQPAQRLQSGIDGGPAGGDRSAAPVIGRHGRGRGETCRLELQGWFRFRPLPLQMHQHLAAGVGDHRRGQGWISHGLLQAGFHTGVVGEHQLVRQRHHQAPGQGGPRPFLRLLDELPGLLVGGAADHQAGEHAHAGEQHAGRQSPLHGRGGDVTHRSSPQPARARGRRAGRNRDRGRPSPPSATAP